MNGNEDHLKYINKIIKIFVNVEGDRVYFYHGKVLDIDSFTIVILDDKEGKIDIPISKIVKIKVEE